MMRRQATGTTRTASMRVLSPAFAALALVALAACGSTSSSATGPQSAHSRPPASDACIVPSTTAARPSARPLPSVRLVSETGVSPAELRRAERLLAETIVDIKRFQTPAMAYAAGYRSIGDAVTGDEHYVNWSYAN